MNTIGPAISVATQAPQVAKPVQRHAALQHLKIATLRQGPGHQTIVAGAYVSKSAFRLSWAQLGVRDLETRNTAACSFSNIISAVRAALSDQAHSCTSVPENPISEPISRYSACQNSV